MTLASLDGLEARLQALLEVHLLKRLPGYTPKDKIPGQLAAAMHGNLKEEDGSLLAPNLYVIVANPNTLEHWHSEPGLLDGLGDALFTAGNEAGFHFKARPSVSTATDPKMEEDEARVLASFSSESVAETRGMPTEVREDAPAETVSSNAFLILDGTKIIPLNRPVINIGRRLDNHIVIDDPRISRHHAQLRIVRGRFVLFDLNSSGGTFINGQRMNQSILYPGDVISLAGISLIFGQDLPGRGGTGDDETTPGSPFSAERPTAILRKTDFFP